MRWRAILAAGVVALGVLAPGRAGALSIDEFARMDDSDDASLVTLLVEEAARELRAAGRPEEAQRAIDFFKDSSKAGGLNQLVIHLREMHAVNDRHAINPNNRAAVLDVEDAVALTLKDQGIRVEAGGLRLADRDFEPVDPPRHVVGH